MELDLEGRDADRAYPILASLVVPRPIALVTTLGVDGVVNAAPFSFFNAMGGDPPIVAFAPIGNIPLLMKLAQEDKFIKEPLTKKQLGQLIQIVYDPLRDN